jgi:deazaflavin-dependent oxidoreductase (nitroreductase family)
MAPWTERHLVNRAMRVAVRFGRDIDGIRELEVRGRRSGTVRRVPVKVIELGGERYVVSLYGNSGWVRNLGAAQTANLRFGRHGEQVVAAELAPDEKRPVVQAYLAGASRAETRERLANAEAHAGVPVFRLSAPIR